MKMSNNKKTRKLNKRRIKRFYGSLERKKKVMEDYSVAVFLDFVNKRNISEDFFLPTYFREEFNIKEGKVFLSRMIKDGYLEKKEDSKIVLSEKGKTFLAKNEDYIRFFNYATPYTAVWEYERYRKHLEKNVPFEKIMVDICFKKINNLKKKDDYIGVQNLYFDVAYLYETLGEDTQSIYNYLICMYLQISGLEYYDKFLEFIEGRCTVKALEAAYGNFYIDPRILEAIKRLKEFYSEDMVDTIYEKVYININLCKKEKFTTLVSEIIDGKFKEKEWQIYFREAFKRLIEVADKQKEKRV